MAAAMPSMFPRNSNAHRGQAPFSEQALQTLGPAVCRALIEHHYETKKKAAKEIEDVISFVQQKEIGVAREKTIAIIGVLVSEFIGSDISREYQIGGLLGLVGVARGLQRESKYYLSQLVIPVLKLFQSTMDPAIKYYAAECLYNMCIIAPADIVVFLDDMVSIVLKMWPESEHMLTRGAGYLDSMLRKLAAEHAASSQLNQLAKCLLAQLNSSIPTASGQPAVYLLPWVQFLFSKHASSGADIADAAFRFPVHQTIAPMLRMLNAKLQPEQVVTIEKLVAVAAGIIRKQDCAEPSVDWTYDLESRIESLVGDSATSNHGPYVKLLLELCGIEFADIGAIEQLVTIPHGIDEDFLRRQPTFVLNTLLHLLAASSSYTPVLRQLNEKLQQVILEKGSRDEWQALGAVASEVLETATSKLTSRSEAVAEVTLGWIAAVTESLRNGQVLSGKSFAAVVGLVSSDRERLRHEAINCVAKLCKVNEETARMMLSSTVRKIHGAKSISTLESYMRLLDSLIAMDSEWAVSLSCALEALPSANYSDFYRRHLTAFTVVLAALTGTQCKAKLGLANCSCKLPEKVTQMFPLQSVLLQLPTQVTMTAIKSELAAPAAAARTHTSAENVVSDFVLGLRVLVALSNSYEWIVAQLNIFVTLLELPCFAPVRGSMSVLTVYKIIRSWLPVGSLAFSIVTERLRGVDLSELNLGSTGAVQLSGLIPVPASTEEDERRIEDADTVFNGLFATVLQQRRLGAGTSLKSSRMLMVSPNLTLPPNASFEIETATCQPSTIGTPSHGLAGASAGRRELSLSASGAPGVRTAAGKQASIVGDNTTPILSTSPSTTGTTAGSASTPDTTTTNLAGAELRSGVAPEPAISNDPGDSAMKGRSPSPVPPVGKCTGGGDRSVESRRFIEDLATAANSPVVKI